MSEDPIAADINLYRYVSNNPLGARDPSGLAESAKDDEPGFVWWLWNWITSIGASPPVAAIEGAPDIADAAVTQTMANRVEFTRVKYGETSRKAWYAGQEYEAYKRGELKEFSLQNPPPPPPFEPAYQGPRESPPPSP